MPEHADDPASIAPATGPTARAALRQGQLAARAALPAETHRQYSQAICTHLWHWFAGISRGPASKHRVGFCLPFRGECDILPLIQSLHAAGWQACVPVVETPAAPMVFRHWAPDAPLTQDRHGIAIPATASCPAPHVLLLPVVAVDAQGYRLGYGGGYFDRTLAGLAASGELPLCIGVGFALAQVNSIEAQPHDRRLDGFVSEQGLQAFTAHLAATLDDIR